MPRVKGSGKGWVNAQGYRVIGAPEDCPEFLQRSKGSVLEHRWVLFQALGEGFHPCQWCGHEVAWEIPHRTNGSDQERWDALVVDHENGDRADNALGNLLVSCPWCNSNRPFWSRFGVSGEDYAEVHPKDRPKLGELAKAEARKAKASAAKPSSPQQAPKTEPKPVPMAKVGLRERPVLRYLAWYSEPSLWSLRVLAAVCAFVVAVGIGAAWGARLVVVLAVAAALAVFVALWVPGPPRPSSSGPLEAAGPAVLTGWPQIEAHLEAYTKQRATERAAAVSKASMEMASKAAAGRLDPDWDDDSDEVVVPLAFPDPSKRGRK